MKKIVCLIISIVFILSISTMFVSAESKPYWYPEDTENFENYHGKNLPRVVDDADVLTEEEEAVLSQKVQDIVDKYGFGYVIFTDTDNYGLSQEVYSADFLYYNGYGVGNTYDAVVFYLSLEEGYRGWRTTSINQCEKIFTKDVCNDIDDTVDSDIRSGNYYSAFLKHVDFVDNLMQKYNSGKESGFAGLLYGTFNKSAKTNNYYKTTIANLEKTNFILKLILCIIVALAIGCIPAAIYLHSLKKKMRVVSPVDARNYLKGDSFKLRDKSVDYRYTTVTKVARPQDDDHSSGGSSFSHGSSSSGGSFSSGGRNF